jgi:cap1 methyltransferase
MVYYRKYLLLKGIGFTLTGRDDFKPEKFKAASAEYLETYYGPRDDGNVLDPENLDALMRFVKMRTQPTDGVHLVMADGGFSVEGQENIQVS